MATRSTCADLLLIVSMHDRKYADLLLLIAWLVHKCGLWFDLPHYSPVRELRLRGNQPALSMNRLKDAVSYGLVTQVDSTIPSTHPCIDKLIDG